VGVSAVVNLNSADQSEEIYDPQKAALVSSQKTEDGPALPSASGVPGTATNLPRATAASVGVGTGVSNYARKTENVSYQTSRIVKHTKMPQGSVSKLSLSVLVDHGLRWEGAQRVVEAPSPAKLKVIHDLVAAAAGFDTARGDQLVVEAFPFEATLQAEPPTLIAPPPAAPPASPWPRWLQKLMGTKNFTLIAGIGAGAMLLLVGGVVFLLAQRSSRKRRAAAELAHAALAGAKANELPGSPEEMQRKLEAQMAEQSALQAHKDAEELMKLKIPVVSTKKTEVLTKHIVAESKKDPAQMAQVVRSWLNDQNRR
jgi:flagellar M-ring protein FliF